MSSGGITSTQTDESITENIGKNIRAFKACTLKQILEPPSFNRILDYSIKGKLLLCYNNDAIVSFKLDFDDHVIIGAFNEKGDVLVLGTSKGFIYTFKYEKRGDQQQNNQ
jgi:hypothetical protein